MTDLEDQLTRHLDAVAGAAEPTPDLDAVFDDLPRRCVEYQTSQRSWRLAAAAVVIVIAGTVGLIAIANNRSPSTSDQPVEPAEQPIPATTVPGSWPAPATTLPTDADGVPATAPADAQQLVPYGSLDFATTEAALPLWPSVSASDPAATTTGYGLYLCDGGYGTKVLRVDPTSGPAHAYWGTLCVFIDLDTPRVDAITTCATATGGYNYARCQRRTDKTDTGGPGTAVPTRASDAQETAMRSFPTATDSEGPAEFTFDLSAALGPKGATDFEDGAVAVSIETSDVTDFVDTPGVCFEIDIDGAAVHGCAGHDLLATGLAYGAFQNGDDPIEIVGIVPDEVESIDIGGTTITPTNNVWHHTAGQGSAPKITATFTDGHSNSTR